MNKLNKEEMIALAEGQLHAYNNRDIEKFCTFFHPNVIVYVAGNPIPTCEGIEAFKTIYTARFNDNPDLHCQLKSRIVVDHAVLDEEWVTGVASALAPSHVVAIYQFKDGLIHTVSFVR